MAKSKERSIVWYDPDNVEAEWDGQPDLAFELGEDYAQKQYEYDCQKTEVEDFEEQAKLIKAELFLAVKMNFIDHGFAKEPSVDVAEAATMTNEGYQKALRRVFKAKQKLNDVKREMAIAYAAVQACKDRKSALEKKVDLMWLSGSHPRARNQEVAEYARTRAMEKTMAKVRPPRGRENDDE